MAYLPPESEVQQVNSLLAIIADPKRAKAHLDQITESTKQFNAMAEDVRRQQKEVDDYKASIKPIQDSLETTKNDLKSKADDLDKKARDLDTREQSLGVRASALASKERDLVSSVQRNTEITKALSEKETLLNQGHADLEMAKKEADRIRNEYLAKTNALKSIL